MLETRSARRVFAVVILWAALLGGPAQGQDNPKKGGSVPIIFVPPPVDNATYSVGIYDVKTGKLARRLCEAAGQNTFKVGLNGLATSWDGKDDDGKSLPTGKYAARGYAVGALKVEGEAVHGNDWVQDDEKLRITRVRMISLVPDDAGLVVAGTDSSHYLRVARYGPEKFEFVWQNTDRYSAAEDASKNSELWFSFWKPTNAVTVVGRVSSSSYALKDGHLLEPSTAVWNDRGSPTQCGGRNYTQWKIEQGVLSQFSPQGEQLRSLTPVLGEPVPVAVTASKTEDRLFVLEEAKDWQRVRGLAYAQTQEENGKPVSTWQTFFERNIRPPDPALGLEDAAGTTSPSVDILLTDNPLSPNKAEHVKLTAAFDDKGSYLSTTDGLRLRQISERTHLRAVKLTKDEAAKKLAFYQTDGAAWDEFSIRGTKEVVTFDAGEFEIDAAGEKPIAEKAPEPDL